MFISSLTTSLLSFIGTLIWVVLCGRFSIAIRPAALKKRFDAELGDSFTPRYNAAPGQDLPVILNRSPKKIQLCRWGFIPSWQKKVPTGARLINARAETIMEKRTFQRAFQKQRCLVLADGFYEWKKTPQRRIPYRFVLHDEAPFAFAGIWSQWTGTDQSVVTSFSIITTDANAVVADVHHRMPVLLQPQDEASWLTMPPEDAITLLNPYPSDLMRAYPVSPRVNSPVNDDPSVIKPIKRRKERVKRIDDFF
ncbi:MAG: SOS response-associated peptidase [Candidatus Heimdallarchaeota archaeon]